MFESYMKQLERQAAAAGITVAQAAKAEGIHDSTIWRWQNDNAAISEETARRISARIKRIARLSTTAVQKS